MSFDLVLIGDSSELCGRKLMPTLWVARDGLAWAEER
jgi:hypothetical protein